MDLPPVAVLTVDVAGPSTVAEDDRIVGGSGCLTTKLHYFIPNLCFGRSELPQLYLSIFVLLVGILFSIDLVVSFLAEATNKKPLRYFYGRNWSDSEPTVPAAV